MAQPLGSPYSYFTDNNGLPLAGGKVYTYAAGTTTPKSSWTDSTATIAAANPVVLDSAGRATIWLDGYYKITVNDALGNLIKTTDNVTSANSTATIPWDIAGGTTDAISVTYNPAIVAFSDGLQLTFRASGPNATTTPTFAPNALLAHTITKKGGSALSPGDIPAALAECIVQYDLANTRWELLNPSAAAQNLTLISTQSISSSTASVSLTTGINSTYSHYVWEISNLVSVTNSVDAYITVLEGTYQTSYSHNGFTSENGSLANYQANNASQINATAAFTPISSNAAIPSIVRYEFWNPSAAAHLAGVVESICPNGASYVRLECTVNNSAAATGLKLIMSSGNIATCTANLYGVS